MNYQIRPMMQSEIYLLKDFAYEAIFQKDEQNLLPRSEIEKPEIKIFYEDFGKPDDNCLVAVIDNKIIGAVWTRILSGDIKGFGNIDAQTPEFAISLYKEYRSKGIGTKLMLAMLQLLKEKGYKKTSLAVQKNNYAVKMYQNIGFKIVGEKNEEYIMVYEL